MTVVAWKCFETHIMYYHAVVGSNQPGNTHPCLLSLYSVTAKNTIHFNILYMLSTAQCSEYIDTKILYVITVHIYHRVLGHMRTDSGFCEVLRFL